MKGKYSIIFLALSFLAISGGEVLALNAPTSAAVKTGCTQYPDGKCIGEGSANLVWNWSLGGSGNISRFVLSYRIVGYSTWTRIYPSSSLRTYQVQGLTGNENYEWTVMAEATNPADNSSEMPGEFFLTRSGGGGPTPGGPGGGQSVNLPRPIAAENIDQLFKTVINFLFVLSLGIGPLMIVYAGFLLLTAGGNIQKTTLAKTIILWTLIALAIILFAKGLTSLVKGALGG